jgi:hypothetical protein
MIIPWVVTFAAAGWLVEIVRSGVLLHRRLR